MCQADERKINTRRSAKQVASGTVAIGYLSDVEDNLPKASSRTDAALAAGKGEDNRCCSVTAAASGKVVAEAGLHTMRK